jgi:uncharacterized repeat protein (TIGR01451 family)
MARATCRCSEPAYREVQIAFKGTLAEPPVELKVKEGQASLQTLTRGRADGEIYVTAENLGNQTVSGQSSPVSLTDVLPAGLRAVSIAATEAPTSGEVLGAGSHPYQVTGPWVWLAILWLCPAVDQGHDHWCRC